MVAASTYQSALRYNKPVWSPTLRLDNFREARRIRAAARGNRAEFDELVKPYIPDLRGFLHRKVGPDGVDDVQQETIISAWTSIAKYSTASRFKAWFYGIALHKCADYHRDRFRKSAETSLDDLVGDAAMTPSFDRVADTRQHVRQAVAALPESQREVLEMYYYLDLTLAEIAESTGKNLNTVKYHFYKAHEALGEGLSDEDIYVTAGSAKQMAGKKS